jgi:hypothetical protein
MGLAPPNGSKDYSIFEEIIDRHLPACPVLIPFKDMRDVMPRIRKYSASSGL